MHALHKILVHLDKSLAKDVIDRQEIIDRARIEAEYSTESYGDDVYDWRETDTAGRWSEAFPENVLLASENVEKVIKELLATKICQEDTMKDCLGHIVELSPDLYGLFEKYKEQEMPGLLSYYIRLFAQLMCGDYNFDSGFLDTDTYSSKITRETIEKVRKAPDEWAMVMFDYHI